MKKDDEIAKRPFSGGDVRDDVIDWAGKLYALGEVWGALSWHENRGGGSTETLEACGETMGRIIMDYAELIENTVTERGLVEDPLAFHEESLKWIIDSNGGGGSAGVVDMHISRLDEFCKTVAARAFLLRSRFEEMKKKYPVEKDSAPAAEAAAAGA